MNPYELTKRAADFGIARAAAGAVAWRPLMECVVTLTAIRYPVLTMDDVRETLAGFVHPPPMNLMAFGAVMQKAQKDGTITKLDATERSRTPSQHRDRAMYRSNIYDPTFSMPAGQLFLALEGV